MEIIGEIGWEVDPERIGNDLKKANGDDLDVYMSTPGGYVSYGITIFNLFQGYKKKFPDAQLSLTVIGEACSMGSYNLVNPVFDLVSAYSNTYAMIHNVWGGAVGDYREMEKTAQVFKGMSGLMAAAYAAKMKISVEEAKAIMDAETWYFGEELKTAGLVDEIIPATEGEKNKEIALALGAMKVKTVMEKMRVDPRGKDDILKVAAMIKDIPSLSRNALDATAQHGSSAQPQPQQPKKEITATGGQNNPQEAQIMNLEQLMKEHPAIYAAAVAVGVKQEKDRVAALLSMKEKAEFKKIPAVCSKIDECIKNGETKEEATLSIMAVLSNGNIQAALESPGDIGVGGEGATPSGEEPTGQYESKFEGGE
jgi:ATP-dependent protease ClpP protease subunit